MKVLVFFLLSVAIFAQDFSGIRIYINPGHGGHDSNDRFIQATGFWESESNLEKGLYLYDLLKSMGATVKISRTSNNSSDDLPLSVIDADANNFDADFFHSIHSNGFQGNANYTVIFYKEVNGAPAFTQAKTMSDVMKNHIFSTNRTTTSYSRGDYSFLGFNLGVLRTLNMPGTLSEGSFHDYIPESWRLMNSKYRKHEAWAILRSMIDYFNLTDVDNGIVAGILRNPLESVDYFSLNGTNDNLKPVNNFIATLLPAGKIYTGDDKNNGFFFFDSIQPGDYTIIVEAENFKPDTFSVTAAANQSKFYDRFLELVPNLNAPQVVSFSPVNGETDVSLLSTIELDFDIRMDRASVENAFSSLPSTPGNFIWENDDKRMIFVPANNLQPATDYQFTISTDAKSYFGVNLASSQSITFHTREKLRLVDHYPRIGEDDVSTSVLIKLNFDGAIDASSLSGNILFLDPQNNFVNIFVDQSGYSSGIIGFEPVDDLEKNTEYRVILKSGISDVEGLNYGEETVISFTTTSSTIVDGNIADNFESDLKWAISGSREVTFNIDGNNTVIELSSARKISGVSSAHLQYEFTSDTAAVTIFLSTSIDVSNSDLLGVCVFGDYSSNILNYFFSDQNGNIQKVAIDTLNFTGWKMEQVQLSSLNFTAVEFKGIQIFREGGNANGGEIYFDDLQTDFSTDVKLLEVMPKEFRLDQNYPNPFNPATNISFSLPEESTVSLSIYNVLGERIIYLIKDEKMSAGRYRVEWNAAGISSGVYFYRIKTERFVETKKMLLIR